MIEEVAYGADGQQLTASFMDYALPRASDFPRFELDNTVNPTPVNPLGAKGVGEAGTIGSIPLHSRRCGERPDRFRRAAPRHDAAAREAVAHQLRSVGHELPGMISRMAYRSKHARKATAAPAAKPTPDVWERCATAFRLVY